jgi:hypothetical protein
MQIVSVWSYHNKAKNKKYHTVRTVLRSQKEEINVRKTEGAIKNGQSREIDNIWYTRHKPRKNKNKKQKQNTHTHTTQ